MAPRRTSLGGRWHDRFRLRGLAQLGIASATFRVRGPREFADGLDDRIRLTGAPRVRSLRDAAAGSQARAVAASLAVPCAAGDSWRAGG
jgi:hypothetical protein